MFRKFRSKLRPLPILGAAVFFGAVDLARAATVDVTASPLGAAVTMPIQSAPVQSGPIESVPVGSGGTQTDCLFCTVTSPINGPQPPLPPKFDAQALGQSPFVADPTRSATEQR